MDQVVTFVGRHDELPVAVNEAQSAANSWLQEHSMAVATVYSASTQSIWHEHDGGYWYHVITITIQYYTANTPSPTDQPPQET